MKTLTLHLPMMYGDHHVTAVRQILAVHPGVLDLDASSCFQTVDIQYDETSLSAEEIQTMLATAGYVGNLPTPEETSMASSKDTQKEPFFRHTITREVTGSAISFNQKVESVADDKWPCPQIGVLTIQEEEMIRG